MKTNHPDNERVKRRYFDYLREARRYSEATVDAAAAAIHRFERHTRFKPFKAFHIEQAKAFKRALSEQVSETTGERLSQATLYSTLKAIRSFFVWLADQPGYRSRIGYSDAEYFNLAGKESRIAKARREQRTPTLEAVKDVIAAMRGSTSVERRDRAMIAFTLLTGARDAALTSLQLKHVDLGEGRLFQDAREVKTKFSKTFNTWFFPVGDEVAAIVGDWIAYLRTELHFGPGDPLFPKTLVALDDDKQFRAAGLAREPWADAAPIRAVFKAAFEAAGHPYANPHSLRRTIALLGERVCSSPEEFKAWSQNLGHEGVLTTFRSYGEVEPRRQAELIPASLERPRRIP